MGIFYFVLLIPQEAEISFQCYKIKVMAKKNFVFGRVLLSVFIYVYLMNRLKKNQCFVPLNENCEIDPHLHIAFDQSEVLMVKKFQIGLQHLHLNAIFTYYSQKRDSLIVT